MNWNKYRQAQKDARKELLGTDYYCDGTGFPKVSKLNKMSFWKAFLKLLKKKKDAKEGEDNGYKG
jgi:hypothetical protein